MKKRMFSALLVLVLMLAQIVPAAAKSAVMLHDWANIVPVASINREGTTSRITNAIGLTIGNKDFLYVTQGHDALNQGQVLTVYDITDLPAVREVERYTNIVTKILADQIAMKDGYLFAAEMIEGSSRLMAYPIGADGRLGEGTKIADGRNGFTAVKIMDDYLFYSEQTPAGSCRMYDISDIAGGVRELGGSIPGYGIFAPGFEKISDGLYRMYSITRTDILIDGQKQGMNGYQWEINDMQINPNGTVTWTTRWRGIEGLENAASLSANKTNEVVAPGQVVVTFWDNTANTYGQYLVDASDPENPVMQELVLGRRLSALKLTDEYYAVGENAVLRIHSRADGRVMKELPGLGGQVYGLSMFGGKLFISAESQLWVYDLYAEIKAEMGAIGEINDSILRINAEIQMTEEDRAVLELFGEQIDVTDLLDNGKLYYETQAAAADGDYTAKLSVVRGEMALLTEEQGFTLRKTRPLVIEHSGLSAGTAAVSGTVRNSHTMDTDPGTIYLPLYGEDGILQDVYAQPVSVLSAGAEEPYSITLDPAIADGQLVKLFAVGGDGRVLSDVTATGEQEFNTKSDKILGTIDGRVNVYAEIDPVTAVAQISGKSAEEAEQDVFISVYKPAPDDAELDYINVFTSNADGSFYCEYPLVGGEEGKNYIIHVAMSGARVLSGTRRVSYYSQTTINSALTAIRNATADSFDAVAIADGAQYKDVYGLNTEAYQQLEAPYQKAVAAAVAGKGYVDIAALNAAFDEQVRQQKAVMDQDHAEQAALEQINTATAKQMEGVLAASNEILSLEYGKLYEELTDAMKLNLYKNWLCDKGFTAKKQVTEAIRSGTAVEYIKQAQYGTVVEKRIIQTYGAELGLNTTSVAEYTALGAKAQQSVIRSFLRKTSNTYLALATNFDEALYEYKNTRPPSGGGTGSKTGGGSSLPIFANQERAEVIDPEDIIPGDVLNLEKNNPFRDVSFDAWYFEAVCALADRKIVEGITDTEYQPNINVKREEFIKMLISAYSTVDYTAEAPFTDVEKGRWYYSYVATAHKLKLINGVTPDTFGTGLDITREDLAKVVYDTMKAMGKGVAAADAAAYADMTNVSGYAAEAVSALSAAGILSGFEDNTFRPKDCVTRAMAAQVIYSALNLKAEGKHHV